MNKTYHWGILGPGKIAHKFATALLSLPNAKIQAVGSRDYHRAEEFGKHYNAAQYYGSYESLVRDPEVDVIYIATPHSEHYENALLCLQNGKNVLCEKAFTSNARQLEHLIKTAREKKLFLMEAIWTRFLPSIEKLLELVNSGVIGEIRMLHADFGFLAPYDQTSRLFNPALAGGSLLDIGIYPLFLSQLLLGSPSEIQALAQIGVTGVDESLAINLRYKNGAMAVLSSTLMAKTPTRADISGTKGRISLSPRWFSLTGMQLEFSDGRQEEIRFDYKSNGYAYEAAEVMNCLNEGLTESPRLTLDFSLNLMKLMDTIREQTGVRYDSDFIAG